MYEKFENLKGKVLKEVTVEDREIRFVTVDGDIYRMFHYQDCCESVYVESVVGDVQDLVGEPILVAEEVTSHDNPEDAEGFESEYQESFTWTFYKLATRKGYVDIRWYGESNGYYSESVSLNKEE